MLELRIYLIHFLSQLIIFFSDHISCIVCSQSHHHSIVNIAPLWVMIDFSNKNTALNHKIYRSIEGFKYKFLLQLCLAVGPIIHGYNIETILYE